MKKKYLLLLLLTFISFTGLAQKDQIKQAQGEFKNGNLTGAISVLTKSEYLIINAEYEDKSEFYNLKADIYRAMAAKNIDVSVNLGLAVKAYHELIREETLSNNLKYIVKAREGINDIKIDLQSSASRDIKVNKYAEGASKMYDLYEIDKNDTLNLYLSTSYFMMAKNYDLALRNYKELQSVGYTGKGLEYYATDKKTNEEILFTSPASRESYLKAGLFEKPRTVQAQSKKTEIYRNMAYIYSEKGDLNSAEALYKQMIAFNPKFIEPYLDLAYLNLDRKKELSDKTSVLGTSSADMKTYDQLKLQMDDATKQAILYLEKGNAIEPKNEKIIDLLLKLYRSMDLTAEYNALKARI